MAVEQKIKPARRAATDGTLCLIVGARFALPAYLRYAAYICQPERSFRPAHRLAFYWNWQIDRHIPLILDQIEDLELSEVGVARTARTAPKSVELLQVLVQRLKDDQNERYKSRNKVLFLSPTDSPETLILPTNIDHDMISDSGDREAFTYGHRYALLSSIERQPRITSELVFPPM